MNDILDAALKAVGSMAIGIIAIWAMLSASHDAPKKVEPIRSCTCQTQP